MRPLVPCALLLASVAAAPAVDDARLPRLLGQISVGVAGFEPAIAAEWTLERGDYDWRLRPEVLLSEDGRLGGGVALMFGVPFAWRRDHELFLGPRVAWHGGNDWGFEASAQATYALPLVTALPHRHWLELIGNLGVIEDEEDDSNTEFSASIGAAYGYQF